MMHATTCMNRLLALLNQQYSHMSASALLLLPKACVCNLVSMVRPSLHCSWAVLTADNLEEG